MTSEDRPQWSQGICGDSAIILRDGEPVSIDEIVDALNQREWLLQAVEMFDAIAEDIRARATPEKQ